jgi:hypothetical protein
MTYAVIRDVPATWEHYAAFGEALADVVPAGLVLHLAGPTDEGFRLIDVWESREDWQRFQARAEELVGISMHAPATLRELDAVETVLGGSVDP